MFTYRSILRIGFCEFLPTFHILLPRPPFLWDHLGQLHVQQLPKVLQSSLGFFSSISLPPPSSFPRLVCKVHHTTFYQALFLWSDITCNFSVIKHHTHNIVSCHQSILWFITGLAFFVLWSVLWSQLILHSEVAAATNGWSVCWAFSSCFLRLIPAKSVHYDRSRFHYVWRS